MSSDLLWRKEKWAAAGEAPLRWLCAHAQHSVGLRAVQLFVRIRSKQIGDHAHWQPPLIISLMSLTRRANFLLLKHTALPSF